MNLGWQQFSTGALERGMYGDCMILIMCLLLQVLHEITMKSIHGRNAEGKKVAKATVQRGKLEDGTPVIGMTMVDQDFR